MSAYSVKIGDTFDLISRKVYGTGAESGRIMRANPGVTEPLTPGTIIVTPDVGLFGFLDPAPPQSAPTSSPNELALRIDGTRFRFWDSISITDSIDAFSVFSFSAPFEFNNTEVRDKIRPFAFQDASVTLGGADLFRGIIIDVIPKVTPDRASLDVSGYALPGILNDCTPPSTLYPVEYDGFGIWEISNVVGEPFGVSVSMQADPGDPFETIGIEPTQKVLDFLSKMASQRNLIITNNAAGQLVYWQSIQPGNPVARFFDGATPPLVSITPNFQPQQYFSHITGIAPVDMGDAGLQFTVQNDRLRKRLRPHVFKANDTESAALSETVSTKAGRMFANAVSYTVEMSSWRNEQDSNNLWRPNTTLTLFAPQAMIYDEYEFLIRDVTRRRDGNEERAILNLVLPGVFSGQIPERMPWDS